MIDEKAEWRRKRKKEKKRAVESVLQTVVQEKQVEI